MKLNLKFGIFLLMSVLTINNVFGYCGTEEEDCDIDFGDIKGCVYYVCVGQDGCGGHYCSECDAGYKLTSSGLCSENCTGCTNCKSDANWSASGTGYQKKITRTCECNTCKATTIYRCAAGYYGSSSNGTSGCARCPSSGGVSGTSAVGSTTITLCYIPSGTTGSDSSGSYTYAGNCYYGN